MNANDLILFCDVVELGSFSKAADKHQLTNSVVSKRITNLERALEVPLLYRTTRKLRLSEAGKALLEHAMEVRRASQVAEHVVRDVGDKLSGTISMSVPTISGELLLAESVAEFCHQHPGLRVNMSLENRFVDLIDEGVDVVVRTGYLDDSSLIARHLIDAQWIVCASPRYLEANGRPQTPTDLRHYDCLLYTYQESGADEWAFVRDGQTYTTKVNGGFSTDNAGAIKKAALAGFGFAYVPRCLVFDELQSGELVELFKHQVAKKLGIYALYPYTKHPLKKVTLLIEHLRQSYQAIAYKF